MHIEALILDHGGVVIHEDPADLDEIGRPLGFPDGRMWEVIHSLPEYRPSRIGRLSGDEFREAVRRYLHDHAEASAADAAIEALLEYYRRNAGIRPVMSSLLASLKPGIRRALLSNGARGSTANLQASGLAGHFDLVLCSGDVGVAKPDPGAYLLAASTLGVPPARCVFVDDMAENVFAARAVGMQAMLYHHTRHEELLAGLRRWDLLESLPDPVNPLPSR